MADKVGEEDVVLPRVVAGQLHEPGQAARHLHHGESPVGLAVQPHFDLHDEIQCLVEQLRKGMRGVYPQRCKHRSDLLVKIAFHPDPVGRVEFRHFQETNPILRQSGHKLVAPAAELRLDHLAHAAVDGSEALAGREAVHAALDHVALDLLLDAGHAHLEKLVEIRAGDAEELHALKQWRGGVERLIEHALIESQPAQLAVEEVLR
jgi:hypothetical protein